MDLILPLRNDCALEKILKGERWGCIEKIKDSTVVTDAQVVYDRAQPKQGASNVEKQEFNFFQFNVDGYGDRSIPSPAEKNLLEVESITLQKAEEKPIQKEEKCAEKEK